MTKDGRRGDQTVISNRRARHEYFIDEAIARARAMENRIFVAVWRAGALGGPFIAGPTGRVLARTPDPSRPYAVGAFCLLAEAATKEMAPGTDAWAAAVEIRS